MYLRVPGLEIFPLFRYRKEKCWRTSWCAMSCYRGWNYSKIALLLAYWNFFYLFQFQTLTHKISKPKIAHSLAIIDFLYICLIFQVWKACLKFCWDRIIFFRDCLIFRPATGVLSNIDHQKKKTNIDHTALYRPNINRKSSLKSAHLQYLL